MSEVEKFVLDYIRENGGLVDPPAYDIYEVLLPEEVADRWNIPAYVQLTFAETEQEEVMRLGYNHPLVEQMVQEVYHRPASSRLYINRLNLTKSDLDELAFQHWAVVNARVQPYKRATISRMCSTYIRFNFKAAILTDEKQERLVSAMMDVHTGSRVMDTEPIERAITAVSPDATLASLPAAPLRWQSQDGTLTKPLAENTLLPLLERAKTAVLKEMEAELSALQTRMTRFRQLDEARLSDYYDGLEKDLQKRLGSATTERRAGLQDKLTAVQTERRQKVADLAERYQIRINLTLLNLLIVQHPKLIQPVQIANRTTQIKTYAVWDPLQHRLEPLYCHVCGLPGQRLYLCFNGHLAHENCLAPACIDCQRSFCASCAHEVGECAVCHQPLCRHSRFTCPDCGRFTCRAHQEMCHGADGKPVDLTQSTEPVKEPVSPAPPEPSPKVKSGRSSKKASDIRRKAKPGLKSKPPVYTGPKPLRMEVVLHVDAVAAYLLGKRDREIATRVWELDPDEGGIVRTCHCEKGEACAADGMILRPFPVAEIEKQIQNELAAFAAEYQLPLTKIRYNRVSSLSGEPYAVARYQLVGVWKNEAAITAAQEIFAQRYW